MGYFGKGFLEKEGIIKRIESLGAVSDKIRVVVKTSIEGRNSTYPHAMLNIDDDLFVSLERYHSIVTTYKELSYYLHKEVNSQNKESMRETVIMFSRYSTDINSVLRDFVRRSCPGVLSQTICQNRLRVDYDWVYVSGLTMLSDCDSVNDYRKRIVDYLRNCLGKKYAIGNFRSQAMELTRFTKKDSNSLAKVMNEDKRGQWILHSPRKLLYHNRYNRCTDYAFKHNYTIIADGAFSGFKELIQISTPNSVKYIGGSCFSGCSNLKEIHLSQNLKSIGISCFHDCIELESIVIPNTVTEICSLAFVGCESLIKIVMPDNLKHIGWNVFDGCNKELKIIINKDYEEELRRVLYVYRMHVVVVDSEKITCMRGES